VFLGKPLSSTPGVELLPIIFNTNLTPESRNREVGMRMMTDVGCCGLLLLDAEKYRETTECPTGFSLKRLLRRPFGPPRNDGVGFERKHVLFGR